MMAWSSKFFSSRHRAGLLFLHGAWVGSTGAFDLPYQDYSWMAYLARNGLDAFSLDLTGYGYATRPSQLNDPCDLTLTYKRCCPLERCPVLSSTCRDAAHNERSDLDDLDTAVDNLRSFEVWIA
jgi:hypothetical protein